MFPFIGEINPLERCVVEFIEEFIKVPSGINEREEVFDTIVSTVSTDIDTYEFPF